MLVWGFTWIAIAYQLDEASVAVALIYRFTLAVVTLVLVLAATGRLRRIVGATSRVWRSQACASSASNYVLV